MTDTCSINSVVTKFSLKHIARHKLNASWVEINSLNKNREIANEAFASVPMETNPILVASFLGKMFGKKLLPVHFWNTDEKDEKKTHQKQK